MFYKNKVTVAMLLTLSTLTVGCGGGGGGDDESQPKETTQTPVETAPPVTEDSSDTDSVEKPDDDTNIVTPEPEPEPEPEPNPTPDPEPNPTPEPEDPYTPPAGYIPEDPVPSPSTGEFTLPTYGYVAKPEDALTNLLYTPEPDLSNKNKLGTHSTNPTLISDDEPYTTTECRLNDLINCADLNGNDFTIPYYINKKSLFITYGNNSQIEKALRENYFSGWGFDKTSAIAVTQPYFTAFYNNDGSVTKPNEIDWTINTHTPRWDLNTLIPVKIDGTDPTGTKRIQYALELMEKKHWEKGF